MPRKGKRQSGTSKQQRGPSGAFSSNNKNDTNINNSTVSDDTDTITMSSEIHNNNNNNNTEHTYTTTTNNNEGSNIDNNNNNSNSISARCDNNLYNNRKSSRQQMSEAPSPGRVTNDNLNRAQQFIKDIRENPMLKDVASRVLNSTIELIYETGASFEWTPLDALVRRCNLTQKQKNVLIHSNNREIVRMHHIYLNHAHEDRILYVYFNYGIKPREGPVEMSSRGQDPTCHWCHHPLEVVDTIQMHHYKYLHMTKLLVFVTHGVKQIITRRRCWLKVLMLQ